ncbi:MAG: hypothetical protein U0W24_14080 [Bacteroidales bacterium]
MKKQYSLFLIAILFGFLHPKAMSQNSWPRDIVTEKGQTISLFQPQPESLNGNILKTRTVVSVKKDKNSEPVFGVFWSDAMLNTDKNTRMAALENIKVTQTKFPDATDTSKVAAFTKIIESEIPKWNLIIPIDEIVATLEEDPTKNKENYSTKPPEILYTNQLTTLVLIDGEPIVKEDKDLKLEKVVNTPFFILKSGNDKKFYLFAEKFWYSSAELEKGWKPSGKLPKDIAAIDAEIQKKLKEANKNLDTTSIETTEIHVSTKPMELIQTDGEPKYVSIEGTSLVYISNSPNDIFKSIENQQLYVLISGRWFKAGKLEGPWTYVESDKLPADFAKIPKGSEKDEVLASVAGTDEAREAVMDANIPQTSKVDREKTTCKVEYDGSPKFEKIEGTSMEVAQNSSLTVIKSENKYYAVDNGVWFVSANATGPWKVSTERPKDVDKIPPENQAYNTKYVYIYDVTPQYIYMGYTPGYMGCYVYGPTVIYGTGYPYYPWYGSVYYPRPVTYGFSMHYNPWTGWSMGFTVHAGFFSFGFGYPMYAHGCWGPPMYRPPYHHYPPYHGHYPPGYRPPYHGGGGYYGNRVVHHETNINIDNSRTNNIYNNRNGVSTRDIPARTDQGNRNRVSTNNKPSQGNVSNNMNRNNTNKPANNDLNAPGKNNKANNNMYSDKNGNIYKNDKSGNWQQRNNNSWQNTSTNNQDLNKQQKQRNNGTTRTTNSNYNRQSSGSRPSGGARPSTGGMRGGRR